MADSGSNRRSGTEWGLGEGGPQLGVLATQNAEALDCPEGTRGP